MVLHEMSGMTILDVSTEKRLHESCLLIVAKRHTAGYYDQPTPPEELGFTSNHLRKYPDKLKEVARQMLSRHKADRLDYEARAKDYALLERAIANQDGEAALAFLQTRCDKRHEEFEIVDVLTTYPSPITSL